MLRKLIICNSLQFPNLLLRVYLETKIFPEQKFFFSPNEGLFFLDKQLRSGSIKIEILLEMDLKKTKERSLVVSRRAVFLSWEVIHFNSRATCTRSTVIFFLDLRFAFRTVISVEIVCHCGDFGMYAIVHMPRLIHMYYIDTYIYI